MLRRAGYQPPVKTAAEILAMREVCTVAATVLDKLCAMVEPGINTYDLDQAGRRLMEDMGAESACYNYTLGHKVFPAYTCLSVNDEVVHGIGSLKTVLAEGDNITVDVVVRYNGWIGDNARTVIVGEGSEDMQRLVRTTEESFYKALEVARPGKRVGDISNAVQRYVEGRGFSVVREFVGHGVGTGMHEEPQIPNYGRRNTGEHLRPGMTLAIEPMVNAGKPAIRMSNNGWTAHTRDGQPAAHYEHTVLITENEPEILTIPKK
ncbi:MAG: type I methionyl aminopeptidase [Verrucomicrobiota bacterium JB024]|nr:type I methionyl aminopeptidase [Verrucomicrobiota bacterium JB024]